MPMGTKIVAIPLVLASILLMGDFSFAEDAQVLHESDPGH